MISSRMECSGDPNITPNKDNPELIWFEQSRIPGLEAIDQAANFGRCGGRP
jgi:hypothetical protein